MADKVLPKFTIQVIEDKDSDEVYEFALEYFMKDEPLSKSMGLLRCESTRKYILYGIPDRCSFKAVDENGKIIGLVISSLKKRPLPTDPKEEDEEEIEDEKWAKIVFLMSHVEKQWDIFEAYPNTDLIMDGKIIAVDPKYRGLGIAGQLIDRCQQHMRENNIGAMKRLCSSHFSARVMEKMGLNEVYSLKYDDFKVNGEVFLKPAAPHVACRAFVMEP